MGTYDIFYPKFPKDIFTGNILYCAFEEKIKKDKLSYTTQQ